tara:strand:+ start:1289 stop:1561 length:273 start_codon:yes stop_codon:yes gene_type:complete
MINRDINFPDVVEWFKNNEIDQVKVVKYEKVIPKHFKSGAAGKSGEKLIGFDSSGILEFLQFTDNWGKVSYKILFNNGLQITFTSGKIES